MNHFNKGLTRAVLVVSLCFSSTLPFSQPVSAATEQASIADYKVLALDQSFTLKDSLYEKHVMKLTSVKVMKGKIDFHFDYSSRSLIKDPYINVKVMENQNGLTPVKTFSSYVKKKKTAKFVYTVEQQQLQHKDGYTYLDINAAPMADFFAPSMTQKFKIKLSEPVVEPPTTEPPTTEPPTTETPTTEVPTTEEPLSGKGYVVVNNENVSAYKTPEETGMNIQSDILKTAEEDLIAQGEPMMIDKNMELTKAEKTASELNLSSAQKRALSSYTIGDTRTFNTIDITKNQTEQTIATLQYAGTKALVWVADPDVLQADAEKIGVEFDENIAPLIHDNFGAESDVDGNGKVNILLFDIKDGFSETSRSYVGGYFSGRDLLDIAGSNKGEVFYMDTYPSMGYPDKTQKDVTKIYSTVAHEFQHMVNFNKKYLEQSKSMDTYLNEAFSMAAEHIYKGPLTSRIDYYNKSASIQNGHSLTIWDNKGDVLSNYSLSYLFGQYLKEQAGIGDKIYKEVLNYNGNTYNSLQFVIHKYVDPTKSLSQFMTDFRIALLKKEVRGPYSLGQENEFQRLNTMMVNSVPDQLEPQQSVVFKVEDLRKFVTPATRGQHITYTKVSE